MSAACTYCDGDRKIRCDDAECFTCANDDYCAEAKVCLHCVMGDTLAGRVAKLRAEFETLREQSPLLRFVYAAVTTWETARVLATDPVGAARVVLDWCTRTPTWGLLAPVIADMLHNCVAHPLLFVTHKAPWVLRFHDATAVWAPPPQAEVVEEVAQFLYEIYCLCADWKNYQGLPCPRWNETATLGNPDATLTEKVRENWRAVASYVIANGFRSPL